MRRAARCWGRLGGRPKHPTRIPPNIDGPFARPANAISAQGESMSERVLRFPADDQVARVWAYRGETCVVNAAAQGEVRVPSDSEVILGTDSPVRGLYE